jgi:hypothetical protein
VDDDVASLAARSDPVPVRPPGAMLGPLLSTLTLADWQRGASRPAALEWASCALLQRTTDDRGWEFYVECRTPPAPRGAPGKDQLRILLGPREAPSATIVIDSSGEGVLSIGADRRPFTAAVAREPERWSAIVPMPEATADGAPLLVGVERTCAGGRFTWPRAVAPWEPAPGRIALDLAQWNSAPTPSTGPAR